MQNCPKCGVSFSRYEDKVYGNVKVSGTSEIFLEGEFIALTTNLRLIVEALIRAEGRPLARDTLLNVSGGEDNTDRVIDAHVCRARRAFTKVNPNFGQIETVRGLGYRWKYVAAKVDPCLRLVA
jgi:DNA-binding response OmpR family regulator